MSASWAADAESVYAMTYSHQHTNNENTKKETTTKNFVLIQCSRNWCILYKHALYPRQWKSLFHQSWHVKTCQWCLSPRFISMTFHFFSFLVFPWRLPTTIGAVIACNDIARRQKEIFLPWISSVLQNHIIENKYWTNDGTIFACNSIVAFCFFLVHLHTSRQTY